MMDGTFNGQILTEKLTKLNPSQQSIETLSHWCIFHRKKARQVVEIWDRQFHCSPREQRLPFLYLANDILQNSRRKGFEFVGEFWNVLPDALNDVYKNGDEPGRKAVSRLVGIWEERKVFGSRGQALREEILGRNAANGNKNGKSTTYKLKKPCGDILEKLISSYEHVHDNLVDEDNLFGRCHTAITYVEKMEKETGNENLGSLSGGAVQELQEHHGVLRECIEQLIIAESSRVNLVSLLKEATREQETIIERIRSQLQVAQSRYQQAGSIFQQLMGGNTGQLQLEHRAEPSETHAQESEDGEKSTPSRYIPHTSFNENSPQTSQEEHRKSAAAAMAERLTASTSSAQMLSYVLSSLASEGVISQSAKEDYSPEHKRSRSEHGQALYIPTHSQPPPPSYPHPDSLQQPPPPQQSSPMRIPSPQLPLQATTSITLISQPPPYMQTAGAMASVPYTYGSGLPPLMPPFTGYPMVGMPPYFGPPTPFHNFQAPEGALFNHAPPPTPPSMSRQ